VNSHLRYQEPIPLGLKYIQACNRPYKRTSRFKVNQHDHSKQEVLFFYPGFKRRDESCLAGNGLFKHAFEFGQLSLEVVFRRSSGGFLLLFAPAPGRLTSRLRVRLHG
jgi:hypothetical protein